MLYTVWKVTEAENSWMQWSVLRLTAGYRSLAASSGESRGRLVITLNQSSVCLACRRQVQQRVCLPSPWQLRSTLDTGNASPELHLSTQNVSWFRRIYSVIIIIIIISSLPSRSRRDILTHSLRRLCPFVATLCRCACAWYHNAKLVLTVRTLKVMCNGFSQNWFKSSFQLLIAI